MYDPELLVERLQTLLEALKRIPRRFADITTPADFYSSDLTIAGLRQARHAPHSARFATGPVLMLH